MTLDHLLDGLLEFATSEQGAKSVTKALKEGGLETLDRVVRRMCEPAKGSVDRYRCSFIIIIPIHRARRAMIVDLALSVTGSQLIASVLPSVSVCTLLYYDGLPCILRPIKTNAPFSTNAFVDILSL